MTEEINIKMAIDEVISLAEKFRCCPKCGSIPGREFGYFYCPHCEELVREPDDSRWFAERLKSIKQRRQESAKEILDYGREHQV